MITTTIYLAFSGLETKPRVTPPFACILVLFLKRQIYRARDWAA